MVEAVAIEREYGSGAGAIAKALATRLGWTLWDQDFTCEIARRLHCDPKSVERCEERLDTNFYRLIKVFMRGSYEDRFSGTGAETLDSESLSRLFEEVVIDVVDRGPCVIVGRASTWLLREREDAMKVFLYAPPDEKLRRVLATGKSQEEAEVLLETVDSDRAAFVRHYYNKSWPQRDIYDLMVNTRVGNDSVIELILHEMELLNRRDAPRYVSAAG